MLFDGPFNTKGIDVHTLSTRLLDVVKVHDMPIPGRNSSVARSFVAVSTAFEHVTERHSTLYGRQELTPEGLFRLKVDR